ncbi:MAG: 1-acyl-sn-glycerol-3-phosphate acyltransferase [Spirochaetales bacterium]|nr:1-acyl-sn-glycerol-3-phosphate acyltransferase [Spirochaetales bacterium]
MFADLSFKILRAYADCWMKSRCRVLIDGTEHLPSDSNGKRAYIVINHSTTFDLVALMHIARNRLSVVMDEGAFHYPVVRHLFRAAGFIPLLKSDSQSAVGQAVRKIGDGIPVLLSLTSGGSTLGKEERPRVGGVRIAHLAGAAIHPVFTMIAEDRKIYRSFKGSDGELYRYTTFRDGLYYIGFLPPIPQDVFGPNETYETYREIAYHLKELAEGEKPRYRELLAAETKRSNGSRWRGGSPERVSL